MNSAAPGLGVQNIHVWRGDRHVLRGVSLELRPGEMIHVSGPNGTGKTTLLRVAAGLLRPESGSVDWRGTGIGSVQGEFHQALAYASHEPALKSDLTALENLSFSVGLKRQVTAAELRDSLERTGVAACAELAARVLSAGQRRRVAMARILALRAALWILDEPYTNLDAAGSALQSRLLEEHLAAGGLALVGAHLQLEIAGGVRSLSLGQ